MNIIHVSFSFLPVIGGAEIVVHNLAQMQGDKGDKVSVLTSWNIWRKNKYAKSYSVLPLLPKTISLVKYCSQLNVNVDWILGVQLIAYIYIKKIDVCHVNYAFMEGFSFYRLLKFFNVPRILTSHGGDIQYDRSLNYGMRLDPHIDRMIRTSINQYTKLTAVSESMRTEYLKLGVENKKIDIIPNGCDIKKFQRMVDVCSIKKKYGINKKTRIILTVGRNTDTKGFDQIPTILEKLLTQNFDLVWIIAGRDVSKLKKNALNDKYKDRLMLLEPREISEKNICSFPSLDIIELYKIASVFVFPSKIESFGMVLVEAMAAQLPIVTTDAPGCKDVVTNDVSGLVSPLGDVQKMFENIMALLNSEELATRIKDNQLKIVSKYSWAHISSQYYEVYKQAIASTRGVNDY